MIRHHEVGKEMDLPVSMSGSPVIKRGKCIAINKRFATYEFDFDGKKLIETYNLIGPVLTADEWKRNQKGKLIK